MYAYSGHPLYKLRARSTSSAFEECVHVHGLSYLPTSLHAAWAQERWLALRQIGDPLADSALEAGLGYYKGSDPLAALLAASREALSEKSASSEGAEGRSSTKCSCNPGNSEHHECMCGGSTSSVCGIGSGSGDAPSPYSLPALSHASKALLGDLHRVPDWVDFAAIARAQRWYLRHLPLASLSVLHVGLIGGFSAPLIHPTLRATGYLTSAAAPRNTRRRVFETMRFVADLLGDCKQPLRSSLDGNSGDGGGGSNSGGCRGASSGKGGNCSGMKDSESSGAGSGSNDGANCLKPGGRGWAACIKVRLVHAAVRHRLLTRQVGVKASRREGSSSSSGSSSSGGSGSDNTTSTSTCATSTSTSISDQNDSNGVNSTRGVKPPVEGGIWTQEDVAVRGLPVCLSDVVATQLAFGGCTLLGMANAGVKFTRDEANDYLHLWRWVGHLLGIPEEHNACAPPVKAKATTAEEAEQNDTRSSDDEGERESSKRGSLVSDKDGEVNNEEDQIDPLDAFSGATAALETVVHYAFAPNDYSQQFAASVLGALGADGPLKAPLAHHHAWAHLMLGHPLADALALPRPPPNSWGWSLPKFLIPCLAYFFRFLAWLATPPKKLLREPQEPCDVATSHRSVTVATAGAVAAAAAATAVLVDPSRHSAGLSWAPHGTAAVAAAAAAAVSTVAVVHVCGWVQQRWWNGWKRVGQRIEDRHHRILNAVMKSVLRSSKPGSSARGSCTAFDAPLSDTLCPAL